MPPAINDTTPSLEVADAAGAAMASVGRTRAARGAGGLAVAVPGLQRDDQGQSDSDDSEMDRLYSLQLARNSNR